MKHVLLYNLSGIKLKKIKVCLARLGLRARIVDLGELGLPIGQLAGLEGFDSLPPESGEPFHNEIMVLNGLTERQLDALLTSLRTARVPVTLKAVVTEHNAAWSGYRLCRELLLEHSAIENHSGSDPQNSPHTL